MAFDISKFAGAHQAPAAERSIDAITAEIIQLKQDAGNAILGIGQRLIEAKAMLPHGEWLPWLTEQVEFSERTARNFMRLAREWTNRQALADLGAAKALTLLALPPDEREQFMAETHIVDGEDKTVIDMTSRELERAVKERDEALRTAEQAKAAAAAAEESRAKMETDMTALKELHRAARAAEVQSREELEKAQAELKALHEKPVDVAVMEVDRRLWTISGGRLWLRCRPEWIKPQKPGRRPRRSASRRKKSLRCFSRNWKMPSRQNGGQ